METNTQTLTLVKRGKKPFVVPEGVVVDWTQNNKTIATQLGVSVATAHNLRKRLGMASNRRGRPAKVQTV